MKTSIYEVHGVKDIDRVLLRVPAGTGDDYAARHLANIYGRAGWGMMNRVTEAEAANIKDRGWIVKEIDVTKEAKVFAIHDVKPEVLAYGMAKYSRSALSLKESIADISSQKAGEFLNTFYFAYGHRSIADMAHVPMALEGISLLAAIEVEDEQRWDGQERSTRYQDFSKREYYVPEGLDDVEAPLYHRTIQALFDAYDSLFSATVSHFTWEHAKPEGVDQAAYERTIRARAFDVARNLLPMATLTSVGQIVNARTLEGQISRLFASRYPELHTIAQKMKDAASKPSYNPQTEAVGEAFRAFYEASPGWDKLPGAVDALEKIYSLAGGRPALAPTLVKYTEPDSYRLRVREFVHEFIVKNDIVTRASIYRSREQQSVRATWPDDRNADAEIAATLLYEHTSLEYSALYRLAYDMEAQRRQFLIEGVLKLRGKHDELPRAFRALGGVTFDIHMDIGGFRDMHRHRRTNQFFQAYSGEYGYVQLGIKNRAANEVYWDAVKKALAAHKVMCDVLQLNGKPAVLADYLLPLGTKCRFLMKMDLAEAAYIAELRTTPAGHPSYRRVAWEIFKALEERVPTLAAGIKDRVTDPSEPLDFFKR